MSIDYTTMGRVVSQWRKYPRKFVKDVFGVEPTEQQGQLLDGIAEPGGHVSVSSGHGVGKSTGLAWAAVWHVALFPDSKTPCTAPTAHQLKDVLWAEIGKWHQKMHPMLKQHIEVTGDRMWVKGREKTQFAVARVSRRESPDALQGFHAKRLLFLIDEASGVDEKIFQVAEGALSTPNARVAMAANPTKIVGYFYRSHHINSRMWNHMKFSCLDSPLVGADYAKNMRDSYGEESDIYRVRVLGEFPTQSIRQLMSGPLVESGRGRKYHTSGYSFAPVVLGVDVAWEGDDRSAVMMRQGLMSSLLFSGYNVDNMHLASLVLEYWNEHKADGVFIDVGWGTGVIDRLRQLGRDPFPVNFGSAAIAPRFANKRTEMWFAIKEWLESGGSIPDDELLFEDLVGPEYDTQRTTGRILLEAKKDMKSRGLKSPDLADALALTFAHPVHKISARDRVTGNVHMAKSEYDLFA
jgi:hypothetical protein